MPTAVSNPVAISSSRRSGVSQMPGNPISAAIVTARLVIDFVTRARPASPAYLRAASARSKTQRQGSSLRSRYSSQTSSTLQPRASATSRANQSSGANGR